MSGGVFGKGRSPPPAGLGRENDFWGLGTFGGGIGAGLKLEIVFGFPKLSYPLSRGAFRFLLFSKSL